MKQAMVTCVLFGCIATALQYGQFPILILLAAVAAFTFFGQRVTRAQGYVRIRTHSHEGPIKRVSLHEGGHAKAIEDRGGTVTNARIYEDGEYVRGFVEGIYPDDPVTRIGVALAGFAAAPDTGSPTDMKIVEAELKRVPAPFRGQVMNEAQRVARKAGGSSRAQWYAERLERKRRL